MVIKRYEFENEQDFFNFAGEVNSGEVIVEPEKCLTIKEIAERFASGYDISEFRNILDAGEELEDDEIDNIPNPQYDAEFSDFEEYSKHLSEVLESSSKEKEDKDVKEDVPKEVVKDEEV